MRAVLDSNIFVSGLNFPGNEQLVLNAARSGRFELVVSPFILREVDGVLARKFKWSGDRRLQAMGLIARIAVVVNPPSLVDAFADDHPDNRVLDCAASGEADYLVTGDQRHLLPLGSFRGVRIVRAPNFLNVLDRRSS